ncbi:response regulator [Marinibaculum pumilum]|uniref:Response regulator n=1 Tax=Marinibaculum pumilum TaxID=1766165 RepID=A0ABV7L9J8_9PROT
MAEPAARHILVCDDDVVQRELLHEMLKRLGYSCDMAVNGREAMKRLRQDRYDLLITDIFMAEMDGIELARELRGLKPDLPVIAVTGGYGGVLKPYAHFMTVMGARAVLRKPFTRDELAGALSRALEGPVQAEDSGKDPA